MPPMSERTVELRVWRQFLVLAEVLHFGRAAQQLNMTQPPLTQAIAQLEATLGLRLFERTKRSVQLSAAGAALLPEVGDLLARAGALPAYARAAAAGEVGRLRLAFVSTVGYELLPQWVRAFREEYPKVELDLLEATGDVQLPLLARDDMDAGFMLHFPGFEPAGLAHRRIVQEPLVLALPEQHRLANAAVLLLSDVLREPVVIFPRRIVPSLYDAIFALYHAAGAAPVVVQEAIQMQTIVNLVSAGLGVAWVPESVMQFQRPGVVYRNVVGQRGIVMPGCETSLVWTNQNSSPALGRFLAFVDRRLLDSSDAPDAPALLRSKA